MRRVVALFSCTFLLLTGVAQSTTVVPPTFASLVADAGTIFVGEVIDVRAGWIATPQGRAIKTHVTFKVEEVWKGSAGAVTQLDFLGGTIGATTMEVVGMPVFRHGQRSVLFVSRNARTVSPLVGFFHGRMRIERDPNGIDRVRTDDGRSLGAADQVGISRANNLTSIIPMRLTELAAAVRTRLQNAGAR